MGAEEKDGATTWERSSIVRDVPLLTPVFREFSFALPGYAINTRLRSIPLLESL